MAALGQKQTLEDAVYVIFVPILKRQFTPHGEIEPDN